MNLADPLNIYIGLLPVLKVVKSCKSIMLWNFIVI